MLSQRSSAGLALLACILTLGLGGCVAEPLAQMAVAHMSPQPHCDAGPNCSSHLAPGPFGLFSKGLTDSFRKLAGSPPEDQTAAAVPPPK